MKSNPSRSSFCCLALLWAVSLSSCTSNIGGPIPPPPEMEKRIDIFEQSKKLFSQSQYEAAYNENQKILQGHRESGDIALYNMGLISAHSANPKKNYPRALSSFRALVKEYPQSPMVEPAKTWINVLEEQQKLAEDRRILAREREAMLQEMDKLKYSIEKSRQVDIEIEKRRRGALQK